MSSKKELPQFSWDGLVTPDNDVSIYVRSNHMTSDKARFQPHLHRYYCGFYVTEGEYVVRFKDQSVTVSKHQCMLIQPGTVHYVDEGTDAKGFALAVNQDLLMHTFLLHLAHNRIYSDFFYHQFMDPKPQHSYVHIQDHHPEITTALLNSIENELQINDTMTKDLAEIGFVSFLAQLSRSQLTPEMSSSETSAPTLKTILHYIQEHSASATLQSTAQHFHYNASYLSRYLSQETGKTFRDWQRQYRMTKAVFLLENTQYNIDTIVQMIGYANTSYFYQAFQEQYQMTPAQYRKEYIKLHTYPKMSSGHKMSKTGDH